MGTVGMPRYASAWCWRLDCGDGHGESGRFGWKNRLRRIAASYGLHPFGCGGGNFFTRAPDRGVRLEPYSKSGWSASRWSPDAKSEDFIFWIRQVDCRPPWCLPCASRWRVVADVGEFLSVHREKLITVLTSVAHCSESCRVKLTDSLLYRDRPCRVFRGGRKR